MDGLEAPPTASLPTRSVVSRGRTRSSPWSVEERTLARLRALRSDLIDPTIAVHNGRIVKRTGDGVLIEFRSVVDAVRCAIEMQNGMIERNAGLPPERRIEFRVGIHLGDVVEESDGDLMGDSVNIAARLEGIADPGGICLSEDAYRQVRDRLKEGFSPISERKNSKTSLGQCECSRSKTASSGVTQELIASTPELGGDPEQEYFGGRQARRCANSRCVRSRCLIILQEPLDVVELLLRTQHVAEAAAQLLDDAACPLDVDLARHLHRVVIAVFAPAQRTAKRIGVLLRARLAEPAAAAGTGLVPSAAASIAPDPARPCARHRARALASARRRGPGKLAESDHIRRKKAASFRVSAMAVPCRVGPGNFTPSLSQIRT